ncbi:hypothetical protein N431DRAFT_433484 [Stipitochalara longipes BDJ]|nr:hypothetical protein N431DRAFT_433484 [Stipitochalara longipes BDJ]
MLPCARVRTGEVDDAHYDASEEESICEERETKAVILEKAIAILDAPETSQRSVSEPVLVRKTWAAKHALRPRPVLTGYSTSDDEPEVRGASNTTRRKNVRKMRIVQRRASWPQPPLTPKAHDSGVQGLDSTDDDTSVSGDENRRKATRHQRKLTIPDVLNLARVEDEGDEDGVAFKGIADADSTEERWRQILLDEHLDRIFNAIPKLPSEEDVNRKSVLDEPVVRASFDTTDEWGIPIRKKVGMKEQLLAIVRLFGCARARKEGVV